METNLHAVGSEAINCELTHIVPKNQENNVGRNMLLPVSASVVVMATETSCVQTLVESEGKRTEVSTPQHASQISTSAKIALKQLQCLKRMILNSELSSKWKQLAPRDENLTKVSEALQSDVFNITSADSDDSPGRELCNLPTNILADGAIQADEEFPIQRLPAQAEVNGDWVDIGNLLVIPGPDPGMSTSDKIGDTVEMDVERTTAVNHTGISYQDCERESDMETQEAALELADPYTEIASSEKDKEIVQERTCM